MAPVRAASGARAPAYNLPTWQLRRRFHTHTHTHSHTLKLPRARVTPHTGQPATKLHTRVLVGVGASETEGDTAAHFMADISFNYYPQTAVKFTDFSHHLAKTIEGDAAEADALISSAWDHKNIALVRAARLHFGA